MVTETIDRFLGEIARIVKEKDGSGLQQYLVIEPPLPPLYGQIVLELKQSFPIFNEGALERRCTDFIPDYEEGEDGGSRMSFISFLVKYFTFLRDVDSNNLIQTHSMLKALLNTCILSLGSFMGLTVLPTVISLCRSLARLAIGLDRRPDLIAQLIRQDVNGTSEETPERVTLVESSANVIREAFKKCLSERSGPVSGIDANGKPEGRRVGIYLTVNLCFKLFFHCGKLRSAEQLISNIYQSSPPLALYPASQRVTFLYYLGRYHFANSHFFRAQLALQAAYDQCHEHCLSQRRLITVYLITANMILGRFPSANLYARAEATGLQEKFAPISTAIRKGDLTSFRQCMRMDSPPAPWFLHKRILLQLSNRCEVLVWRSLARRAFLLSGNIGDPTKRTAPTLRLEDLLILATFLETRALLCLDTRNQTNGHTKDKTSDHTNGIFLKRSSQSTTSPWTLPEGYIDPDLAGAVDPAPPVLPTIESIECTMASLIEQDLLHGFISHAQHRFAITGAKNTPNPLLVGFPRVWDVIKDRADYEVPGWVKEEKKPARTGPMGGMVVNLSGARPAGAGPG